MRKLLRALPIVALLLCATLIGCSGAPSAADLKKLPAPARVKISGSTVSWGKVENASGYRVIVDGKEYETESTSFDLSAVLTSAGTYTVEVMALGDGNYTNSSRVSVSYKYSGSSKPENLPATPGLQYKLSADGSGYEVYKGSADIKATLVIPEKHNGLPVTHIHMMNPQDYDPNGLHNVIKANTVTTKVYLPSTLRRIGTGAFLGFHALEEIVIPDGVKIIDSQAFYYCINLKNAKLPDGLETLGSDCFLWCSSLKTMDFPESVKTLGKSVFSECRGLTSVKLSANITFIPDDSFYRCTALEEVEFPEKLETIGQNAFLICTALKSIVFANGLKEIRDRAFMGCRKLEQVKLPESLTRIGTELFADCISLKSIVFPEGSYGGVLMLCYGCNALEWIVTSKSMPLDQYTSLEYLKEQLPALNHVFYPGTKAEWDAIFEGKSHPKYESLVSFYSEEPPTDEGRYWRFDGDVPVIWE